MPRFINISGAADPVYIDTADISALVVTEKKDELRVYMRTGHDLVITAAGWKVDIDAAVQKLVGTREFMSLPGETRDCYYSPAAISYVAVSAPVNGEVPVILGVKGCEPVECRLENKLLTELLARMEKNKPMIVQEICTAAGRPAQKIYIDPAEVRRVRDDGFQLLVSFEKIWDVDVLLKEVDVSEILERLYTPATSDAEVLALHRQAEKLREQENRKLRKDFAAAVAESNGTLTRIPHGNTALYLRTEDITHVAAFSGRDSGKPQLQVAFKKSSESAMWQHHTMVFETPEDREKALEALNASNVRPARNKRGR